MRLKKGYIKNFYAGFMLPENMTPRSGVNNFD